MTENIFDKLRNAGANSDKTSQWFQAQIKKLGTINTNQLMREGTLTNQLLPGNMYMFLYDAKLKEKLPFYDSLPLVLPYKKVNDGFMGLNLHYLPYMARLSLLSKLDEFRNNDNLDENTKLLFNWRLLESSSKFNPTKACVKHYLNDYVQSRFLKINYPDWVIASQLPVERFNVSKQNVWNNSRRKY